MRPLMTALSSRVPLNAPLEPPDPATMDQPAFVGLWAPGPNACSPRRNRTGLLPAVIGPEGAWAGEASCAFRSAKKLGAVWRVVATCSHARERWTAQIRLMVAGGRLTWASERGQQHYVRCPRVQTI